LATAGPSNQKRDLRYLIALAKELEAGIIPVGLYKHFLDRLGDSRSAEAVLSGSRQRQRQQDAGGDVSNAVLASKAQDDQGPGKSVDRTLSGAATAAPTPAASNGSSSSSRASGGKVRHTRKQQPELVVDETHTPEGVPYCLGSKLTQYMPPDLLFDW
jgi:hypothetical protein